MELRTPHHVLEDWPLEGPTYSGVFVAIEGIDGSGRTTLASMLSQHLLHQGIPSSVADIVPENPLRKKVQKFKWNSMVSPATRHMTYAGILSHTIHHTVAPQLQQGYIVVGDRSYLSLLARAHVQNLDDAWAHTVLGFALKPDLVIELDVTPEIALARTLQASNRIDPREIKPEISGSGWTEKFLTYQRGIRRSLKTYRDSTWITINARSNPHTILQNVIKHPLFIERVMHHAP